MMELGMVLLLTIYWRMVHLELLKLLCVMVLLCMGVLLQIEVAENGKKCLGFLRHNLYRRHAHLLRAAHILLVVVQQQNVVRGENQRGVHFCELLHRKTQVRELAQRVHGDPVR
jgi:hypothetical protein